MIRINQIKMPLHHNAAALEQKIRKRLGLSGDQELRYRIIRKSIDARNKPELSLVYSVEVSTSGEEKIIKRANDPNVTIVKQTGYHLPGAVSPTPSIPPVIVGAGPAGLFCAYALTMSGCAPVVLERGRSVTERTKDVERFWESGVLDTVSNVQFGEGGAGTFSDGKLTTGIKDPLCRFVIDELANHGAPEEIRWSAKPHIGTDRLAEVVRNIRKEIISLGGEIRFNCKMTDIIVANGYIHGVKTEHDGQFEDIETDTVLLCTGHSARDTVRTLYAHGVRMMQKPFSVGARIEHPREFIDRAQYGDFAGHPALGAADYKLACHPEHGRGAYTFCMCPGGTVVNAASEEGGIVVNGMSEYGRDAENSNSALLVGIEPENFGSDHPLAGMDMQRKIEHAAFLAGGSDYTAPAQLVGDFLADRPSTRLGAVHPSCPTGVVMSDLRKILPKKVTDTYADALLKMDKMLKGFAMPEAVFTAPETRSSSPVRILRDEIYQSNIRGLYPCGEGAGYAGGIVSAGVDGVRCAYAVLADENDEW